MPDALQPDFLLSQNKLQALNALKTGMAGHHWTYTLSSAANFQYTIDVLQIFIHTDGTS